MSKSSGKGMVQLFTGDGKGKTSAALGAALRAAGHGLRVFIVFFMKGNYPYGEYRSLSLLPNVKTAGFGFECLTDPGNVKPEEIEQAKLALEAGREALHSGSYDLVILDEVNVAVAYGLLELEDVLKVVKEKPQDIELILTGRYADPRLIALADLATEMVKLKHPYDKGVLARQGIEY